MNKFIRIKIVKIKNCQILSFAFTGKWEDWIGTQLIYMLGLENFLALCEHHLSKIIPCARFLNGNIVYYLKNLWLNWSAKWTPVILYSTFCSIKTFLFCVNISAHQFKHIFAKLIFSYPWTNYKSITIAIDYLSEPAWKRIELWLVLNWIKRRIPAGYIMSGNKIGRPFRTLFKQKWL